VDIQLHDSQSRCNHLAEDNDKLLQQLQLQRKELEAEKLTNAQVTIMTICFCFNEKKILF
jgi:hypothetical protein